MKFKRGVIIALLILIVLILLIKNIKIGPHGNVSFGNVSLNVFSSQAPIITINSPSATIYKAGQYDINVSVNKPSYCMYHLGGGVNTTLNATTIENRSFHEFKNNVTEGLYSLLIYCNDTEGLSRTSSVSFAIVNATANATSTTIVVSGGGGGGGGGSAMITYVFNKTKVEEINANKIFGQSIIRLRASAASKNPVLYPLRLSNPYNMSLTYLLSVTNESVIQVSSNLLEVGPSQKLDAALVLTAPNSLGVGVYLEKLLVSSSLFNTGLSVIYEIVDYEALLEIQATASSKFVNPGEALFFDILPSYVDGNKKEVSLKYYIKDLDGRVIIENTENYTVEEGIVITRSLQIPKEIALGDYALVVEAGYDGISVYASDVVRIGAEIFTGYSIILFLLVGFGALVLWYEWKEHHLKKIIYYQHNLMRDVHSRLKEENFSYLDAVAEIERLRWQKHLLDQSFSKSYINKDSYQRQMESIDGAIKDLRTRYRM